MSPTYSDVYLTAMAQARGYRTVRGHKGRNGIRERTHHCASLIAPSGRVARVAGIPLLSLIGKKEKKKGARGEQAG